MNLLNKFRQEKSLVSESQYLSHTKSLGALYEKFSAKNLGLVNASSLDIGAGNTLRNPFDCEHLYGVDVANDPTRNIVGADLVVGPIPFDSNSFDYITAYDFIEHIPRVIYNPLRRLPFIELMNEIHRVLKPGGIFFSHTPIYPYASAFRDPTHVNIITVETFPLYFDDKNNWGGTYGFTGRFKILQQTIKRPHLISILQKV